MSGEKGVRFSVGHRLSASRRDAARVERGDSRASSDDVPYLALLLRSLSCYASFHASRYLSIALGSVFDQSFTHLSYVVTDQRLLLDLAVISLLLVLTGIPVLNISSNHLLDMANPSSAEQMLAKIKESLGLKLAQDLLEHQTVRDPVTPSGTSTLPTRLQYPVQRRLSQGESASELIPDDSSSEVQTVQLMEALHVGHHEPSTLQLGSSDDDPETQR